MKAVRFDHYGDLDVLQVVDVDPPQPQQGEVLVRVRAAAINPGEASIRKGLLADRWPATFPSGEGSDLAGVVRAVGAGVTHFEVGDEVLGWSEKRSSHAEQVVVPESQLIPKPGQLSWEVAGSLYVVGATAYAAVRAVGARPGDTVAVSAAAGGVGSMVVQLLKVAGAEVIGIASASNHEWLRSVGAVPVAYGDGLAERLRAAAPQGIDAFIDTFGPQYVQLAADLGIQPDRIDTIIAYEAAAKIGAKTEGSFEGTSTQVLTEVAGLLASGSISLPIAATYPLAKVQQAFAELEQRHVHGKIVLLP